MSTQGELSGRVALVVGAGPVARAAAARLAGAGAGLMLVHAPRADGALESLADSQQAQRQSFDTQSEADWADLTGKVLESFGRLDVLVNAHEGELVRSIEDLALEDFRSFHRQMLHTAFLGVRFGADAIRRGGRGGAIINLSSIAARVSGPGLAALSSVHGGLRMLTKAAALELGPEDIRVNTLQLGPESPAVAAALHRTGPEPTAEQAADAILFLASERARFMTGAELVLDGGVLAGAA